MLPLLFFIAIIVFAILWYRRIVPKVSKKLLGLKGVTKPPLIHTKDYSYHLDSLPGGEFVDLGHGRTRFYLLGPVGGQKIVLLHGIGTASIVWMDIASQLAKNGFRVLVYDFWGRGYSDSPGTIYDDGLFVSQLYMLLSKLKWYDDVIVCGWSLGGAISTAFTHQFPEVVKELILIAPAGLVSVPFLGEFLMHSIGPWLMQRELTRLNRHDAKFLRENPHVKYLPQLLVDHLKYSQGFLRSYHSSLVNFPLGSMQNVFKEVGKCFRGSVKVIWGINDEIVPFACSEDLKQFMPKVTLIETDGRHDLVVTHTDLIIETILACKRSTS